MRKYIAIIIASLALCTGQAHAQRCLPKMQGIEVRANMADGFNPGGNDGGHSFGAALSTYTKKGNKWVFGGEYLWDVSATDSLMPHTTEIGSSVLATKSMKIGLKSDIESVSQAEPNRQGK